MRQPLPETLLLTIDEADLEHAIPYHESAFAVEECPVSQALKRSLPCATALVGFEGAVVFRTAAPNPFRLEADGHGAHYRFRGGRLPELITAYDAGDFGLVRRLLPMTFAVARVAA